jgi:hypothetical protein
VATEATTRRVDALVLATAFAKVEMLALMAGGMAPSWE